METRPTHLEEPSAGDPPPLNRAPPRRAGACLLLTLVGAGFGLLSLLPQAPALVCNFSESLPVGLYRIEHTRPAKNDIVALAPAGGVRDALQTYKVLPIGRLLLKRLAATSGDTVCRSAGTVTINGDVAATARLQTTGGRALPAWSGCYALQAGEIFVLAPHAASFDGRYLGPMSIDQIVGVAHPLFTLAPTRETP